MGNPFKSSNGKVDGESKRRDDASIRTAMSIATRLSHVTYANFTLSMGTGSLAIVLGNTPHQFNGLHTIGKIVFIFDILLYITIISALIFRFTYRQESFRRSLSQPTESLFLGAFILATNNIIECIQIYGVPSCGPWLVKVLEVLFWIYVAASLSLTIGEYWYLFTAPPERLTVASMSPASLLPALGAMLAGTVAGVISPSQPPHARMPILIGGLTMQGFGWMLSFIMYGVLFARLMQYGLPNPEMRMGLFIAIGPPGYTALALIRMAENIPTEYGYFASHPGAVSTLQTMALFIAIFLWTLAFWFFCIALISVLAGVKEMKFHLVWWSIMFPNVGFTLATSAIGGELNSPGILWIASAMTIALVFAWIATFITHIVAIWREEIYIPEDKGQLAFTPA